MSIRLVTVADLPIVLRAQEASTHEIDAVPPEQVIEGLLTQQIRGIVLEAPDRQMLLLWRQDGQDVLLMSLYREGSANGFIGDVRAGMCFLSGVLREQGVKRVYCCLGVMNPNYRRLLKLYRRLGFRVDLVRMGKSV